MLFGALFVGLLDNQVLSPILIDVAEGLQTSVARIGTTVTAYALAAGLAGLFIMPYADRRGRARFLKGAVGLFTVASLTAAGAPNWKVFYGARVLAGLAGGVISAGVITYAADLFPYAHRGRVMGVISSSYFAAPILGIPLAAQIVGMAGWRYVYLLFGVLAGTLRMFMGNYLPELIRPPDPEPSSIRETYREILGDRSRQMGICASFFLSAGTGGFITYLGPWLRTQFNLSVKAVSLIYLLTGLTALVGALGAGVLADRLGKKRVILVSNVLSIGLLGWLIALPYGPTLLLALALTGLATSFRFGPMQALLTELVPAQQRSTFIGLRNTVSQMGIAFSALVAGLCYPSSFGFPAVVTFSAAMTFLATLVVLVIVEPKTPLQPAVEPAVGHRPTDAFDV